MGITFLSPNPPDHPESEGQNLWCQVAQIRKVRSPTLRVYSECGWSSDLEVRGQKSEVSAVKVVDNKAFIQYLFAEPIAFK
jgi:hypothetical protein